MMSTKPAAKASRTYHPQFSSLEADVILISAEDTAYRVPHFTLRHTSGFFRSLLSNYSQSDDQDKFPPVDIHEKDRTLSKLLCMICGLHTDNWESIDEVDEVLCLAQRLDTPGPLSIIRGAITSPMFLAEPLRLYAIATRLGWDEEAQLASTQTLMLDLYHETYRPALERISSRALMTLFRLHRDRRDEFKRLIDSDSTFDAGNAQRYQCSGCGEDLSNHTWRELKTRMFLEMDRRPSGDTLCGLDMEEWPEAIACWEAQCNQSGCGRLNYNKMNTLRDIRECVDKLPLHC